MNVPQWHDSPPASDLRQVGPRRWIALLAAILVLTAVAIFLLLATLVEEMSGSGSQAERQPGAGKKLSELALESLTGEGKQATLETLAGKVVVVNFWGTWCPPCRLEFPHLVALGDQLRQEPDFRMFLVSCAPGRQEDPGQLKEDTEAFLASSELRVPTYWDPGFKTRLAFHRAAILRGFPTTFVLDRQGVIRGIWTRFHPSVQDEIRELVLRLIQT